MWGGLLPFALRKGFAQQELPAPVRAGAASGRGPWQSRVLRAEGRSSRPRLVLWPGGLDPGGGRGASAGRAPRGLRKAGSGLPSWRLKRRWRPSRRPGRRQVSVLQAGPRGRELQVTPGSWAVSVDRQPWRPGVVSPGRAGPCLGCRPRTPRHAPRCGFTRLFVVMQHVAAELGPQAVRASLCVPPTPHLALWGAGGGHRLAPTSATCSTARP